MSIHGGIAKLFGYGMYVGDSVPTESIGFMGEILKEEGIPNPKIVLDNGQVVYGCECWWGDEEVVRKKMSLCNEVINVDIDKIREEARAQSKGQGNSEEGTGRGEQEEEKQQVQEGGEVKEGEEVARLAPPPGGEVDQRKEGEYRDTDPCS